MWKQCLEQFASAINNQLENKSIFSAKYTCIETLNQDDISFTKYS